MPYFKDSHGCVHFIDDAAFAHLLPPAAVEIEEAEAAALSAPPPDQIAAQRVIQIKTRLAEIDAESIRAIRSVTVGKGKVQDDEKLIKLDDEAAALRAEIATL